MEFKAITAERLLKEFAPLMHKTIQRLNIHQHHMHYEDYFQELQIQLLEIFSAFEGDAADFEGERFKFTAYAAKGLYWHGLNLIRQEQSMTFQPLEEEQIDWLAQKEGQASTAPSTLYVEEFFVLAKGRLSGRDYVLFLYLAENKYTMQELADLFQVSRDTIYRRKSTIQRRLQDLKKCLTD